MHIISAIGRKSIVKIEGRAHRRAVQQPGVTRGILGVVGEINHRTRRHVRTAGFKISCYRAAHHDLYAHALRAIRIAVAYHQLYRISAFRAKGVSGICRKAKRNAIDGPIESRSSTAGISKVQHCTNSNFLIGSRRKLSRQWRHAGRLAALGIQQAAADALHRKNHAVRLALGESGVAAQIAVIHVVNVQVVLVGGKARIGVRRTTVHTCSAGHGRSRIVGRRIANFIAVHGAVVVGTAALKSVIKAEIMPHFVNQHRAVGLRTAHVIGLHHQTVVQTAMRGGEIGVTRHAAAQRRAANLPHHPNVDVAVGVPADEVF